MPERCPLPEVPTDREKVFRLGVWVCSGASFPGAGGTGFGGFAPPFRGFEEPVTIHIDPGTSSRELAETLEQAGVIRSRWLFLAVRCGSRTVLMAGEYRFTRPLTVWEVFDKISRGQVEYHRLTIPEGLTRFKTADLIAGAGAV